MRELWEGALPAVPRGNGWGSCNQSVPDHQSISWSASSEPLQHMSVPQLIDTILINPTVLISPSYRDTGEQHLATAWRQALGAA